MLRKILLENWRSHARTELEFGKGTNVIIGKMGSGKSSVMNAICFALFGTFPLLQGRKISAEEVIMAKPFKAEQAKVKLWFEFNNKEFVVERTIRRGKPAEAMLYINSKLVAGPKVNDVNERIEKELELNYELFSRAIYSEQNQLDFFLRLSPRERKQKFDELLGLERYESARELAQRLANRFKARISESKELLLRRRQEFDKEKLKELESRHKQRSKEKEKMIDEKTRLEKELSSFKAKEKELEELEQKYKDLNELLLATKSKREQITKIIEETEAELRGKTLAELQKELESLSKEREKIISIKNKKEAKKNEENNMFVSNSNRIAVLKAQLREIEESIKNLESIDASCPLCLRSLDKKTKQKIIAKQKEKTQQIEKELAELNKKSQEIEERIKLLNNEIAENDKKIEDINKRELNLKENLSKLKQLNELKENNEKLEAKEKELEQQISKIPFKDADLKEIRTRIASLTERLQGINREINLIELNIKEIENSIEELKKQIQEIEKLEKHIAKMELIHSDLQLFVNSLASTQADLRSLLVEEINLALEEIWPRVYPYKDYSAARLIIDEGSYELVVRDRNNNWTRVEGILSGGERSAAAICIRIAFALVLTRHLGWLILDEPTHNLDSNAVNVLAELLREHLPEFVEQIFIITHQPLLENAATSSLYIFDRDKAKDEPTKVTQAKNLLL
ncbi:MAG: AAA family ATPase [Candidatus Diapherotrites archaeon]|nr:AAA family ATPase [Candidatus Diapherotrites archaeon]